jgi:osmotically-inducible protein OsmY
MTRRFFSFSLLGSCLSAAALIAADKVVSDDTLVDKVRMKLASDQIVKGGGLDVDVKDGVVTLKGSLDSEKRKDKAEKLARKVSGVKSVVNQIQVVAK